MKVFKYYTYNLYVNHIDLSNGLFSLLFQVLNLSYNYIGKLANDSFTIYPDIRKLLLGYNKVYKIEPGSLSVLEDLETLDLSHNAMDKVPNGLPESLRELYLNGNPIKDTRHVVGAIGLRVLSLNNCDLNRYPTLGVLPSLVELDVSYNQNVTDLDPMQLANTCRLAKLDVTETGLFQTRRRGSHCRCRRVMEWAIAYQIRLTGLVGCPDPVDADLDGGPDDPGSVSCARLPEMARVMYEACASEWERRNAPHWILYVLAATVLLSVLVLFIVYRLKMLRNRRRDAPKHLQVDNVILAMTSLGEHNIDAIDATKQRRSGTPPIFL